MSYSTLPASLLRAIDEHPSPRAQMYRGPERWEAISSEEFLRRIAGLANSLVELGVKPGDRVGLFAPNCPEWHTADFAINGSGAVTVPVYFNESPDRMAYILNHSGPQIVFISGLQQLQKFLRVRETLIATAG
jgi:long-chain acyl-CoA synthetase